MHSSRMRTARSSSRHWGLHTPSIDDTLPGAGTPWQQTPGQIPLNFPLGCGPGDLPPPGQIPLNFPLGCGLETPLARSPSTSTLGVGLETCKACWDTITPWRPAARHAGIPPAMQAGIETPVDRILDIRF